MLTLRLVSGSAPSVAFLRRRYRIAAKPRVKAAADGVGFPSLRTASRNRRNGTTLRSAPCSAQSGIGFERPLPTTPSK